MIMDEIKFGRMLNKKVRDTLVSKDTKQTAQEIKSKLEAFFSRFSLQEFP